VNGLEVRREEKKESSGDSIMGNTKTTTKQPFKPNKDSAIFTSQKGGGA